MNAGPTAQVVVGYDDSPGSTEAVFWAAQEAIARRLPLLVLTAQDVPTLRSETVERQCELQRRSLDEIVDQLRRAHPEVHVRADVCTGPAAGALLEASRHAAVVVVGSRRLGSFGSIVLGSVGCAVAAGSACPVVVVREPSTSDAAHRVVVGVNAAQETHAVLEFAFDYASTHALRLEALMCADEFSAAPHGSYAHLVQRELEPLLAETLQPWRDKRPDVDVTATVSVEHPVAGLFRASLGAALVVVGSHGHRSGAAGLLGSVSQGLLHHAQCPVAVVPIRN